MKIAFKGFTLDIEIDSDGDVTDIFNEAGIYLNETFSQSAIIEIEDLVEKQLRENKWDSDYDRGEQRALDRAEERMTCV